MSEKILINCRKVYETGDSYFESLDRIKKNKNELKKYKNKISYVWKGIDSESFLSSFSEHIENLTYLINYLEFEGGILRSSALDHNTSDNNFSTMMRRSDEDV